MIARVFTTTIADGVQPLLMYVAPPFDRISKELRERTHEKTRVRGEFFTYSGNFWSVSRLNSKEFIGLHSSFNILILLIEGGHEVAGSSKPETLT